MLFALILLFNSVLAEQWAVVVAGSNGFYNYRHQADACHAYQILRARGLSDDRIIMFQFDDIAQSPENPFPGKMFNKPSAGPGVDVYKGCPKDYTGADVTPTNFINAITGNGDALQGIGSGKYLKSTANDTVFINFVDHGGVGIICFPSENLKASTLNDALQTMHEKQMYSQLVFYLEACESGSMFQSMLPTDINVYATTAANPSESSWGTYCPPDDFVNGRAMDTCLGDLYSVNWMEDVDSDGVSESLEAQFLKVRKLTAKSHVEQFGTMDWTNEPIGNFMGSKQSPHRAPHRVPAAAERSASTVASPDIPMHLTYYKYLRAGTEDFDTRLQLAQELQQTLQERVNTDVRFMSLAKALAPEDFRDVFHAKASIVDCGRCCEVVLDAYEEACSPFTDYSLQYTRVLVNMCAHARRNAITVQDESIIVSVVNSIRSVCVAQAQI